MTNDKEKIQLLARNGFNKIESKNYFDGEPRKNNIRFLTRSIVR